MITGWVHIGDRTRIVVFRKVVNAETIRREE